MSNSLIDVLNVRLRSDPEKKIYHYLNPDITIDKSVSISELCFQASLVAAYINKNSLSGARIILIFDNSAQFLFSFYGVILSHAIPVCVDPSKRNLKKHLAHYLYDLETTHILTLENKVDLISSCLSTKKKINLHIFQNIQECYGEVKFTFESFDPPEICFIQYTSGSTGRPKGVVVSHENIIANSEQIKEAFQANENSIGLSWLPHFHDMGLVGGLIAPLVANFPVYIVSHKLFAQCPLNWLRAISKYRVTITGGPNIAYEYLNNQKIIENDLDLSSWRVAFIGADFISSKTLIQFAAKMAKFQFSSDSLVPCYGMSEATLMVCSHKPGEEISTYTDENLNILNGTLKSMYYVAPNSVSCGKISSFTDVIIVRNNKVCDEMVVGEICISGKNVVREYWNQKLILFYPDEIKNHSLHSSYYKTGDIGVLIKGELFVIGRSKELLIINGINISPTDIECDIQDTSEFLLSGRGIVYQETSTTIGLIQEIEKKSIEFFDLNTMCRNIRLVIFRKYGLLIGNIQLLKRGSIITTTSGKIIRSKRAEICSSSVIFEDIHTKGASYG